MKRVRIYSDFLLTLVRFVSYSNVPGNKHQQLSKYREKCCSEALKAFRYADLLDLIIQFNTVGKTQTAIYFIMQTKKKSKQRFLHP